MQTTLSNLLGNIQNDLKKYESFSKQMNQSITSDMGKIPEKDREFFSEIQARINKAVVTGDTKDVMNCQEELMNYLKEQDGTSN